MSSTSSGYYSEYHCQARVVSKGFIEQCKFKKLVTTDGTEYEYCKKHQKIHTTKGLPFGNVSVNPTPQEEAALKKRLQILDKPRKVSSPCELYIADFKARHLSNITEHDFIANYKPMVSESWKELSTCKKKYWTRKHLQAIKVYEEKLLLWKQQEYSKNNPHSDQIKKIKQWKPSSEYKKIRLNIPGYKNICLLEHCTTGKIYQFGQRYLRTVSKDDLFSFAKRIRNHTDGQDKFIITPGEFTSDDEDEE